MKGCGDLPELVARVGMAPGAMTPKIDDAILATRIVMADTPKGQDETLFRNIARAHAWFRRIKAGETCAQIAEDEGTSKRRIQQMIDLAFLAPDIVWDVLDGRQPMGFTSDWCKTDELPSDWSEQRALSATLCLQCPTPRTIEMPCADFGLFTGHVQGG